MKKRSVSFTLRDGDVPLLEQYVNTWKGPQNLALRARIVLMSGEGQSAESVAAALGTATRTVYAWRRRYLKEGIDGLTDRPRPGQPCTLTTEKIAEIESLTRDHVPTDATQWSLRLMAHAARASVYHVQKSWYVSGCDPRVSALHEIHELAEAVTDVVGLHVGTAEMALVLAMDVADRNPMSACAREVVPVPPARERHQSVGDGRQELESVYALFDRISSGNTQADSNTPHAKEFSDFMASFAEATPSARDQVLLLGFSKGGDVEAKSGRWAPRPETHVRMVRTRTAWLQAAHAWLAHLNERHRHRGLLHGIQILRAEMARFIDAIKRDGEPAFSWIRVSSNGRE